MLCVCVCVCVVLCVCVCVVCVCVCMCVCVCGCIYVTLLMFVFRLTESRNASSRASQACSQLQTQVQGLHSDLQQRETALQATLAEKATLEGLLKEARGEILRLRERAGQGEESGGFVEEVARLELEIERLGREREEREEEMAALQNQLKVKLESRMTYNGTSLIGTQCDHRRNTYCRKAK